MWVHTLGWEDPLEESSATHSSVLAWKIPQTDEPRGLQSTVSQSWTRLSKHAHTTFNILPAAVSDGRLILKDPLQARGRLG